MRTLKQSAKHTVVLSNESNEAFTQVLEAYKREFQPRDQVEHDLVVELAASRWRLRRVWDLETSLIDLEMAQQSEAFHQTLNPPRENLRTASAFKSLATAEGALALLTRYEARIRNSYTRALRDLQLLRSGKLQVAQPSQPVHATSGAGSAEPVQPVPNKPKPPAPPQPGTVLWALRPVHATPVPASRQPVHPIPNEPKPPALE